MSDIKIEEDGNEGLKISKTVATPSDTPLYNTKPIFCQWSTRVPFNAMSTNGTGTLSGYTLQVNTLDITDGWQGLYSAFTTSNEYTEDDENICGFTFVANGIRVGLAGWYRCHFIAQLGRVETHYTALEFNLTRNDTTELRAADRVVLTPDRANQFQSCSSVVIDTCLYLEDTHVIRPMVRGIPISGSSGSNDTVQFYTISFKIYKL
jgi:hypothetical protein